MESNTAVLMVIFVFTFLPLILAEAARKKSLPTLEDFFLYSRKMPAAMAFFTVYATWVSSFAFMGTTTYFYEKGPVYLTCFGWNVLFGVLFYVVCERIWFYGKRDGYITPTDFFKGIFNYPPLNVAVTVIMLLFTLPYLQIQLAGGAYLIEAATEGLIPWRISGLIFYLIIIIYLWAGGIRAVAMADVFYGILLFASMLIAGIFLINKAGGVAYVFHTIAVTEPELLTLPGPDKDAGMMLWLSMFFIIPLGAIMGPQIWIRSYAVHKRSTFRIMPLLVSLATIEYLGPIFSGAAGRVLEPGLQEADSLIPTLLLLYAPKLLCAVLFCGIAAAALSTANSQIHAAAAIYTIDIHKKFINPGASEKRLVSVGKWAVLGISALAYLTLMQAPGLIIETGTIAMSGTAQVFIPTLGALFWKRSNKKAAFAGLFTGAVLAFFLPFFCGVNANYGGMVALAANGLIFIAGSCILRGEPEVRNKIITGIKAFERDRK